MSRKERGFGAIVAILVLVVLAALAAATVSFATGQNLTFSEDLLAAQSWQLATAGTEGGLFRALQSGSCDTQTWTSTEYPSFKVTTVCSANNYNDGERSLGVVRVLRVFRVQATACNGSTATCPDNTSVAGPDYVERQSVSVVYCEWNGSACIGP